MRRYASGCACWRTYVKRELHTGDVLTGVTVAEFGFGEMIDRQARYAFGLELEQTVVGPALAQRNGATSGLGPIVCVDERKRLRLEQPVAEDFGSVGVGGEARRNRRSAAVNASKHLEVGGVENAQLRLDYGGPARPDATAQCHVASRRLKSRAVNCPLLAL